MWWWWCVCVWACVCVGGGKGERESRGPPATPPPPLAILYARAVLHAYVDTRAAAVDSRGSTTCGLWGAPDGACAL